ncbi:hypothetical protein HRR78_005719 [Exophiala dermatitidis]|nr:hypothetical protein HRR75_004616 [Exophiala dermatitidis]KAJ4545880.1 hypothetical protein HRR78_005719 [Exophiala dermatitidis]
MADSGPLEELKNYHRPTTAKKTYGKKKKTATAAHTRAMHFELFGGGGGEDEKENEIENKIVDEMEKLTMENDTESDPVPDPSPQPTGSQEQEQALPVRHKPDPDSALQPASGQEQTSPVKSKADPAKQKTRKVRGRRADPPIQPEQEQALPEKPKADPAKQKNPRLRGRLPNPPTEPDQEQILPAKADPGPAEQNPKRPARRADPPIHPGQEETVPPKADPDPPVQLDQDQALPVKANPAKQNPKLRGRRKVATSRKMAKKINQMLQTLTPDKRQKLEPLLAQIEQRYVRDFWEFGQVLARRYLVQKLGEGAYGDVFRLRPTDLDEAMIVRERGGLVIKVIPFTVDQSDSDDISDLEAVTREITILQTLDPLPGFPRCRGVHVVSGEYPDVLIDAFRDYQNEHDHSAINEEPSNADAANRLYVVIEMDDAGVPMHKVKQPSAFQVFDIFWKTAIILANAEGLLEFEHRDLHNGNICIKASRRNGPTDVRQEVVEDMEEEPEVTLGLSNLQVTIIDFTFARAKVGQDSDEARVVFDPIEYWEDCSARGQSESDNKQYDTYRKVRDWAKVVEDRAKATAALEGVGYLDVHKYARYLPKSNVMWLGYLIGDLLSRSAVGRGACLPGSSRAAKRLQLNIWRTLEGVNAYVNAQNPTMMPESASDLLATSVSNGWLSHADLAAFRDQLSE